MRRRQASAKPEGEVISFAWYRPDQWAILKLTAADRENLDDSYEEWLKTATQRLEELQAAGVPVRKVDVDVSELSRWCRSRGVPLDSQSRAEFAAYKAQSLITGSNTRRRRA